MYIIGIESSCDETAVSIVKDGRIIVSNVISTQIETHKEYGGVVPEIASRLHTENISLVFKKAIADSDLTLKEIDAIAVTFAPGLIGPLLVGLNFAKAIALASNKPLIPVHHIRGHIAANYLTYNDLKPPFLCLVVSGGHSHIIEVFDYTKFKVIGQTKDDAAGEAFDKAARALGFGYPGGIQLDKLSQQNGCDKRAVKFPIPKMDGYNFSFSGLKTSVINYVHNASQKNEEINKKDIAASFCETVATILCDKLFLAADNLNYKKIVIAGGVSANSALRNKLKITAKEKDYQLFMPDLALCADNGAMIAAQGYFEFLNRKSDEKNNMNMNLNAYPYMPVDEEIS